MCITRLTLFFWPKNKQNHRFHKSNPGHKTSGNLANRMVGPSLFKISMLFVRAWWHRCASLPHEINTWFSFFRMYNAFDQLFWLAWCLGAMEGIGYQESTQSGADHWQWDIIWFVDTRCACTMIIVHACTIIIIHAYSMITVSANNCARGRGLNMTNFMLKKSNRKLDPSSL